MNLTNICQAEQEIKKDMSTLGYTRLGSYDKAVVYGRGYDRVPYVKIQEGVYMMGMNYKGKKYIEPKIGLAECVASQMKYYEVK